MDWYIWLAPLVVISFCWRVNEWLNGRAKRKKSGLLLLAAGAICALIFYRFGMLFGCIAIFVFFLSAAFFHTPAEFVARRIFRRNN